MGEDRPEEQVPQFSYQDAAGLTHMGHGKLLSAEEQDRVGAGGSALTVLTLLFGIFGLGPVGLVTGYLAMRGQRTSSWLATLGMVLSAAHTLVLLAALVLAAVTG